MDERCLDVTQAVDYLEEVLGAAWLKENLKQLKNYAGGGAGFGRSIELASSGVAAAAYYWYRAREELALGLIGGQEPGICALQAAVIGDDLRTLRGSRGLPELVERLKRPEIAGNALAELAIAAGYAGRGDEVVFTNRDGIFHARGAWNIYVSLEHVDRLREDGNPGRNPDGNTGGLPVIYRHRSRHGYDPGNELDDRGIGSDVTGCAGNEVPVVQCAFIARLSRRGPEIVRAGRLLPGCGLAQDIYIPNTIIRPGTNHHTGNHAP